VVKLGDRRAAKTKSSVRSLSKRQLDQVAQTSRRRRELELASTTGWRSAGELKKLRIGRQMPAACRTKVVRAR